MSYKVITIYILSYLIIFCDIILCIMVDSYLQTIIDNPCVPNEDNSLDSRVNEMRWCTLHGGLDG